MRYGRGMSDKKKSGCVVAAVVGLVVLVAAISLVAVFSFKAVRAAKREVQSQLAEFKAREEARAAEDARKVAADVDSSAADEKKVSAVVKADDYELPDISHYQKGTPLSSELFLAAKLGLDATTLAKEAFMEKAEGAEVVWKLLPEDIETQDENVIGKFYLQGPHSGHETRYYYNYGKALIECRFATGSKESLLSIRRGRPAMIGGRLSVQDDQVVILDARLVTEDVEK